MSFDQLMYNPTQIRDTLKDWTFSNKLNNIFGSDKVHCRNFLHYRDNGLTKLPLDNRFIYYYNLHYLLAQQLMINRYWQSLDIERCANDPAYIQQHQYRLEILKKLMFADMESAVAPIAATAWFTIDNWRWSDENLQQLSYGLVLQYPELLIFGAYLSGLADRTLLLKEIEKPVYDQLIKLADDDATNKVKLVNCNTATSPSFNKNKQASNTNNATSSDDRDDDINFDELIP